LSRRSDTIDLKAPAGKRHTSLAAHGILHGLSGDVPVVWQVPEEVPVALQFNSEDYAVMMATPADIEDLAVGFAISEGLVDRASDISAVLVLHAGEGLTADIAVAEARLNRERMARRSLEGRTGCGLCGIEDMKDAIRMPARKAPKVPFSPLAVARAFEQLPAHQPMNALNRTVHAAAWCTLDGDIRLSREDVGRHNALDKLIGVLARTDADFAQGFVVMSSRCSFELVRKCAHAGIGALATISAPTALALSLAGTAGLQLAAHSQRGIMIFDRD
jgi:FdhD protein